MIIKPPRYLRALERHERRRGRRLSDAEFEIWKRDYYRRRHYAMRTIPDRGGPVRVYHASELPPTSRLR